MSAPALWSGLSVAAFVLVVGGLWWHRSPALNATGRLLPHQTGIGSFTFTRIGVRLEVAMGRAGVLWPVTKLVRAWGATFMLSALAATVLPTAIGAVMLMIAGVGPALALHGLRNRADRQAVAQLPFALDGIARALRSGAAMAQAVGEVGSSTPAPLGPDLALAARHHGGLVAGLEAWSKRRPNAEVHLAAAALCMSAEVGGTASMATEGLASTLRQRAESAAEIRTMATQSRLSGLVIGLLPVGFAVLAATSDVTVAHFLFVTPAGTTCLLTGLALDALGAWWMLRLSSNGVSS